MTLNFVVDEIANGGTETLVKRKKVDLSQTER